MKILFLFIINKYFTFSHGKKTIFKNRKIVANDKTSSIHKNNKSCSEKLNNHSYKPFANLLDFRNSNKMGLFETNTIKHIYINL